MLTQQQKELYPLSTERQGPIPLDVVRALSFMMVEVTETGTCAFTIPSTWSMGYVYSTIPVVIQFGATSLIAEPVAGTAYENAIYVPELAIMTVAFEPGAGLVTAMPQGVSGQLLISALEKWANVGLPNRLNRT